MTNPYLLDLPAVVSFSGGRTSGFLLRKTLDAHGGQPESLKVCFQNTGLEHQATYDFVDACAKNWGVDITWLEYCLNDNKPAYRVVDFGSARRGGEPFTELIEKKNYLPNPMARICTANLKIGTLDRYLKTLPGFSDGYTNAVGLRFDEPRRVHKLKGDNAREAPTCPMYAARHTEADVLKWWSEQSFDLGLPVLGNTSNCVGCYLKGKSKLMNLMVEMPEHFDWWVKAESIPLKSSPGGGRFRNDRPSYAAMMETAKNQGQLFPPDGEDTLPCMCTD
jgi:3'-phosphoadenosine 5'-phosphosulfate sulfotransferase (PAPS reductase)/FAD synthetase